MNIDEVCEHISKLSSDDTLSMCKEIYDWRYVDGKLPYSSLISLKSLELDCPFLTEIEDAVMNEAHNRFGQVVLLLMKDKPSYYIR